MVVPYGNKKSKTNQLELKSTEKKKKTVISKPSENKSYREVKKSSQGAKLTS